MKKLISAMGLSAIVLSGANAVVSCNDVANFGYYQDTIMTSFLSQSVDNGAKKVSDYIDYSDNVYNLNIVAQEENDATTTTTISGADFIAALNSAIAGVVSGSTETSDYTINISDSSFTFDDWIKDSSTVSLKKDDKFDITLKATKSSKKWAGSSSKMSFVVKDKSSKKSSINYYDYLYGGHS